jgi:hypothetical protein
VKIYRDQIWKHHGIPKKITSDRGPQFASQLMKDLCDKLGMKRNLSTAYHPQTDGQVEHSHQETETFLRHFVNHLQDDWNEWLAIAEYQYNDKEHATTKQTPFYLNNGRHPWKGEISPSREGNVTVSTYLEQLQTARQHATDAIRSATEAMCKNYNTQHQPAREYKAGDLVWLESVNVKEDRPTKKLSSKRYGPFKVLSKKGNGAYELEIPAQWKFVHPVFNEKLLTPYVKPKFDSQRKRKPPAPTVIGSELEYEVEKILDSRKKKTGWTYLMEYLIKWKGYTVEHNSWEPKRHVHAKELIAAFHKRHPLKPK